ncbi:MAG TPA: hypothetical protein VFY16_11385 [Gemmatimonadaceae bacterium]|nr:hypothetical protein [Gemmatimonadaceae bacterium]
MRVAASTFAVAALAACTPAREPTGRAPPLTAADTVAAMASILRHVVQRDTTAAAVWPGFRLAGQPLFLTAEPNGPVMLVGDPAPPAEYRPLDARADVHVRAGPPPDSLRGLRIGLDWRGRGRRGTVYPFHHDNARHSLVHEAFHTFQRLGASDGRFPGSGTPHFPDSSPSAVALLALEGRRLAAALDARTEAEARSRARDALALRRYRCARLGARECRAQRGVELVEGTAEYAAARTLRHDRPRWRDSLRAGLLEIDGAWDLRRGQYYQTGLAWLLLLERLAPVGWTTRAERVAPDLVLAEVLGVARAEPPSRLGIELDPAWSDALAEGERLVAGERWRRDSIQRAFDAQPGLGVRIHWVPRGMRSTQRRLPPGGPPEDVVRFGGEGDVVVLRGQLPIEWGQVPPVLLARSPVAGRVATVDGRAVPLDQAGATAIGAVVLDLPTVRVAFRSAELRVYTDSVVVRMR